ncbi:hypothetical protein [Haloferula sp. A504]|uniref:hypothetical protein n=1 Tax=Haloferula sp. A504 TaxID=3373601 RepID=UPI0031C970BA|nr:hypothetical protein [Verrucomicrobiaceae bacterium E54]
MGDPGLRPLRELTPGYRWVAPLGPGSGDLVGVVIDWAKAVLQLELLNGEGGVFLRHPVPLEDLQAGGAE